MDTLYIVIQIFCTVAIIICTLVLNLPEYLNVSLLIPLVINIFILFLNKNYMHAKLGISSSIMFLGSIQLGEYFIHKDQVLDLSYAKYELIPLFAAILDIFHVNFELNKKWFFPIKVDFGRFLIVLGLYFLNVIAILVYYFYLDYTFIDHTIFAFVLSLLVIKVALLIYGRNTKTEIIYNEITWCFKKIQFERTNFDRLDQDVVTELYIGSALNSPIIKETLDVLLLCAIGFFYGTNQTNVEIFSLLSFLIVSTIVIGKNRI